MDCSPEVSKDCLVNNLVVPNESYTQPKRARTSAILEILPIASGPFYDAFTSGREGWNLITISAFDMPNLADVTLEALLAMAESELDQKTL
jgi:hypothetical protein